MFRFTGLVTLLFLFLMPAGGPMNASAQDQGIRFFIGEEVTEENEHFIIEGIRFAEEYSESTLGTRAPKPFSVSITSNQAAPSAAAANPGSLSFATEHQVWHDASPIHKLKIIVHEYFHLIQYDWIGDAYFQYSLEPAWLLEGSAELYAFQAVASLGLTEMGAVRDRWIESTIYGPMASVPLESMVPNSDPSGSIRCCFYETVPLAVELLMGDSGYSSVEMFYKVMAMQEGLNNWEAALRVAFRTDVTDFYQEFGQFRQSMWMAGYDLTHLQWPTFTQDFAAEITLTELPTELDRGEQVLFRGWTAPGVACWLTLNAELDGNELIYPTRAGSDGSVFWLVSIPENQSPEMTVVTASCGASEVQVSLPTA